MGGGDNNMLKLFINMKLAIARLMDEDEGQGLTEYALILALIAIVAIAALTLLGGKVTSALSTVGNSLST
jgi:pilus assembly protein Flp/PilA